MNDVISRGTLRLVSLVHIFVYADGHLIFKYPVLYNHNQMFLREVAALHHCQIEHRDGGEWC